MPQKATRWLLLALTAAAMTLSACGGDDGNNNDDGHHVTPTPPPPDPSPPGVRQMGAMAGHIVPHGKSTEQKHVGLPISVLPRRLTLPALAQGKTDVLDASEPGQPLTIGVGRTIESTHDTSATAAALDWQPAGDGHQAAAISVRSPRALALRLGLQIERLPQQTRLQVQAPDGQQTQTIDADEILQTLARNRAAGDADDTVGVFWLPTIEGDEAVLTIELPTDVPTSDLQVALPLLSHHIATPDDADHILKAASLSCNVDASCVANTDTERRSVAKMIFVGDRGRSYLCTGVLLNNARRDMTPYFLSAHHCISRQSEASSMETWWHYRSASCNSSRESAEFKILGGGAQLLYRNAATDTSFMQLTPTSRINNVVFAGWDATSRNGPGSHVFAIHNPSGDWQKYSAGRIIGMANCDVNMGSCFDGNDANGHFIRAEWAQGLTEAGSSGGPLFSSTGQVIGQLWAGDAPNCAAQHPQDFYGRFDQAFSANVSRWLAAP